MTKLIAKRGQDGRKNLENGNIIVKTTLVGEGRNS